MRFRRAVEETEGLEGAYQPGLQAMSEADRARIYANDRARFVGSVNLDAALAESHPNDSRWDYGLGLTIDKVSDSVVWVEVHPASSAHVQEVLDKLHWLMEWLRHSAPLLDAMPAEFVWVATGKVAFQKNSPQRKKLAKAGIRFAGKLLRLGF